LIQCAVSLSPGNACTSIVSSGDIDAVLLHLFAISHQWPRNEGEFFKNPVHVESTCDISASPLRCLMSFSSSFLVNPYCASKCPLIGVQKGKQV
jgi:hypothetical protein